MYRRIFIIYIIIFFTAYYTSAQQATSNELAVQDSMEFYTNMSKTHLDSSKYYEKEEDFTQAYNHFVKHLQYTDTLRIELRSKKVEEAERKYNLAQAEQDLKLLEQDHEIVKQEVKLNNVFITILIIVIVLAIAMFYLFYQINKIKSRRHRAELIERNLRQQLNPEFILDTVNTIQNSLFSDNKDNSQKNLSLFAKYMRLLLDNSQHQCICLKKEFDLTQLYIDLEGCRIGNTIDFYIQVDDKIDTLENNISSFLLQSQIEAELTLVGDKDKYQLIEIKLVRQGKYIDIKTYFLKGKADATASKLSEWVLIDSNRKDNVFLSSYGKLNFKEYKHFNDLGKMINLEIPVQC